MPPVASRRPGLTPGQVAAASPLLLPLLLLTCYAGACRVIGGIDGRSKTRGSSILPLLIRGAPILPQGSQPEQELKLWNEIDKACSSFLSTDSQPQTSSVLEKLCFIIMGILPKPQKPDEKDNTKRFLFHYSKTQKLGNSNVVSSVVHPLLQLVPQLHERRMKRFRMDEFQGPFASRSRGYFLFRPRNGRSSSGFN